MAGTQNSTKYLKVSSNVEGVSSISHRDVELNLVNEAKDNNQNKTKGNDNNTKINIGIDKDDDYDEFDLKNLKKQENESFIFSPKNKISEEEAEVFQKDVLEIESGKSIATSTKAFSGLIQKVSFVLLIIAMFAISSGGVVFKMFPADTQSKPLLISQWRYQNTLFFYLPMALFQFYRMSESERKELKSLRLWIQIFGAAIGVTMWSGTWAVAMNYTTLTRAYLINNCQPLIIVVWNRITGKQVNSLHIIGTLIGFLGLVMTCVSGLYNDKFNWTQLIGDGIAFSGAIFACVYLSLGGKIREKVPAMVFLAPLSLISCILFTMLTFLFEKTTFKDLIGWSSSQNILHMTWFCIITGLLGIALISFVLKYLPSLMISVVLLFEPISASIMSIILKVEKNPSFFIWIGAILVTIGILIVTIGYNSTIEKKVQEFMCKCQCWCEMFKQQNNKYSIVKTDSKEDETK